MKKILENWLKAPFVYVCIGFTILKLLNFNIKLNNVFVIVIIMFFYGTYREDKKIMKEESENENESIS